MNWYRIVLHVKLLSIEAASAQDKADITRLGYYQSLLVNAETTERACSFADAYVTDGDIDWAESELDKCSIWAVIRYFHVFLLCPFLKLRGGEGVYRHTGKAYYGNE